MLFINKTFKLENYLIKVIGCSAMGNGKFENQDSVAVEEFDKQIIIAVADGLGSASYSKEGSKKIVDIIITLLHNIEINELSNNLLNKWKEGLEGNINQYDTTVKFIQIKSDRIIFGGVGDGWIAFRNKKTFSSFTANNEFSNQTDSILSINLSEKFWTHKIKLDDNCSMLISTDGFSEDIDKENGDEFLKQVEKSINESSDDFLKDLEQTMNNWPVETNKDDKTVVFITVTKENE